MLVRMTGGIHAGEVRQLPFLAARGALLSGLAEELKPKPVVVLAQPPVVAQPVEPAAAATSHRPAVKPLSPVRRFGRRR